MTDLPPPPVGGGPGLPSPPPPGYPPVPPPPYPPWAHPGAHLPPPPAGPPGWDPQAAAAASKRRVRRRLAVTGVLALVGLAGAVVLAEPGGDDRYPDEWDPRVAELAEFVEEERGGPFEHPVEVLFLTDEEYSDATRLDPDAVDAEGAAAFADTASLYRSLALAEGDLDLLEATSDISDDGTLAFYDPGFEQVVVRGTELTVDLRVTLVHELTHAWQDQTFDLDALFAVDEAQADAVRGLVEGDAIRIENVYIDDELSTAEQDEYFDALDSAVEDVDPRLEEVPAVLLSAFDAPYAFGVPFVAALDARSSSAVDDAFAEAPSSQEQLVDVTRYLDGDEPVAVRVREVDDAQVRQRGTLGWVGLYVLLAERIDPAVAMRAADGWGGDSYALFEREGDTCVRVEIETDNDDDRTELAAALREWRAGVPDDIDLEVSRAGDREVVEGCDPGADADLGVTGAGYDAMALPVTRAYVLGQLLGVEGVDADTAFCVADESVRALTLDELTDPDGAAFAPGGRFDDLVLEARRTCG